MLSGSATIASSQSFSIIQRRMLLSPCPASPVNNELPLCTSAIRLPNLLPCFILLSMLARKSIWPSLERVTRDKSSPLWVTQATTGSGYTPILQSDSTALPSGLSPDPTKAVQAVTGPDGQSYPVFIYIIMVQPNGSSGYVKQVTVEVTDPNNTGAVIAKQSSLFDPNVAP